MRRSSDRRIRVFEARAMIPALILLLTLALVAAVAIWFLAHGMDHFRIQEHLQLRGQTLLELQNTSPRTHWLDLKGEKAYRVKYRDADGNVFAANAFAHWKTGVRIEDEEVLEYADHVERQRNLEKEKQKLELENRYLRERLSQLEQQKEAANEREYFD